MQITHIGNCAVAMTGIEYFGLKVCVLVPDELGINPQDAAEGFTKHINECIEKANQPSLRDICEVSASMIFGTN